MRSLIAAVFSIALSVSSGAFAQGTQPEAAQPQNPFRALNPELFDRGERINSLARELRRVAMSGQLTDADTITALQIALGGELAAFSLRKNPSWSPDQKRYFLDQILDTVDPNGASGGLSRSRPASATTERQRKRSNRGTIERISDSYPQRGDEE